MTPKKLSRRKKEADAEKDLAKVERDGFTAAELGEESAYEGTTEMAQRMQRSSASRPDLNRRKGVGAPNRATRTKR